MEYPFDIVEIWIDVDLEDEDFYDVGFVYTEHDNEFNYGFSNPEEYNDALTFFKNNNIDTPSDGWYVQYDLDELKDTLIEFIDTNNGFIGENAIGKNVKCNTTNETIHHIRYLMALVNVLNIDFDFPTLEMNKVYNLVK